MQYSAVQYNVLAQSVYFFLTFCRIGRLAVSFVAVELTINNRSSRRLLTKRFKMYVFIYIYIYIFVTVTVLTFCYYSCSNWTVCVNIP